MRALSIPKNEDESPLMFLLVMLVMKIYLSWEKKEETNSSFDYVDQSFVNHSLHSVITSTVGAGL